MFIITNGPSTLDCLAGFIFGLKKLLGVPYCEVLGQIHFWVLFVSANLTIFKSSRDAIKSTRFTPEAYFMNKITRWEIISFQFGQHQFFSFCTRLKFFIQVNQTQ